MVWSSPFDACKINGLFKLPTYSEAERNRMMESLMQEEMEDILKTITKSVSKWNTSSKGIKTLALTCLIVEAHLWLYFIKRYLLPTMHDATISKDRAAIYCITRRIQLDIGRIIAPQIRGPSSQKVSYSSHPL